MQFPGQAASKAGGGASMRVMISLNWLARLPVGLFAAPVGLFALAGTWRRGSGLGWTWAPMVAQALGWLALFVLGLLTVLYAAKLLRHPQAVLAEYTHPLASALMALLPLAYLLCIVHFGQADHGGWLLLLLLMLACMGAVAFRIVALITTGGLPAGAVTPALYIPPVAGGLVGGMALAVLGHPAWAALLFGMGVISWALLEMRVLNRLFEGAMPEVLRPTIGVELAPPTITTLSASVIWPQLPADVLLVGLGLAAGPLVAVLARYRWWSQVPFTPGFWSFSFPVAALASCVLEAVRRGGWPPLAGGLAMTLASTVIAYLLLRTLILLVRGRLLLPQQAASASRA